MKLFYNSAVFAAAQVLLLIATVYLLNRNKKVFAAVIIVIKFWLYVRGVRELFTNHFTRFVTGTVGYIFGLVIGFAAYVVIRGIVICSFRIHKKRKAAKAKLRY